MRKLSEIFALFLFASLSTNSIGQVRQEMNEKGGKPEILCDTLRFDNNHQVTTYIGHVHFQTDKFKLTDADSAIFNKETQKLVAYGASQYSINGRVKRDFNSNSIEKLEYTIGDDVVYMK